MLEKVKKSRKIGPRTLKSMLTRSILKTGDLVGGGVIIVGYQKRFLPINDQENM